MRNLIKHITTFATFLLLHGIVGLFAAEHNRHDPETPWGYGTTDGPAEWGNLSTDFALCCDGRSQSPIDLTNAQATPLSKLDFDYRPAPLAPLPNAKNLTLGYSAGCIHYAGSTYTAVQFHFHHPGEHTIDGKTFPMELHIVHQNSDGQLAVVGVMIAEGAPSPAFDTVLQQNLADTINVADLLPLNCTSFYAYDGSLTTPPCSENVRWFVLTEAVTLSPAQIRAFCDRYQHNARPVQPLNGRKLLQNNG